MSRSNGRVAGLRRAVAATAAQAGAVNAAWKGSALLAEVALCAALAAAPPVGPATPSRGNRGSAAPGDYDFITDGGRLKDDAVRDLVAQLADPEKGREAAERLARFGRRAVGPLVEALLPARGYGAVRSAPAEAGGARAGWPDARSEKAYKRLQVRFYAATVLDIIGDPRGVRALHRRLVDEKEHPIIRRIAVRAMGRSAYAPAAPALVKLARGSYPGGDGGGPGARAAGDARGAAPVGGVSKEAAKSDATVAEPLPEVQVAAVHADVLNEEYRFEVVRALSAIGSDEADGILVAALADGSARIRKVAAQGLGDHRIIAALPALRKALSDEDGAVARAAAKALARCYTGTSAKLAAPAQSDLIGDLIAALDRREYHVRRAAMGALTLATGHSYSTPEKWKAWWERKTTPPEERAGARRNTGTSAERDFPLPAVMATEVFKKRPPPPPSSSSDSDASSSRSKTPPALRMPWDDDPSSEE